MSFLPDPRAEIPSDASGLSLASRTACELRAQYRACAGAGAERTRLGIISPSLWRIQLRLAQQWPTGGALSERASRAAEWPEFRSPEDPQIDGRWTTVWSAVTEQGLNRRDQGRACHSDRGGDPGGVGGVRTLPEIEASYLSRGQGGSRFQTEH